MVVLKFGQSTLKDVESIEKVLEVIINSHTANKEISVVVSAMYRVSSRLFKISQLAMVGDNSYKPIFQEIENEHFAIVKHFVDVKRQAKVIAGLKVMLNDLEDILYGVFLLWELSPRTLDHIMTYGVKMSAYLIAECLKEKGIEATDLDAQRVIVTNDVYGNASVDLKKSIENIKSWFAAHTDIQVVTGYIGSTPKGESSTLGRSGAVLTSSLLAAGLAAKKIEIYTDKDGITNTDSELVKNAFSLTSISYAEAMEMSHFGTKLFYPPALQPALSKNIPIIIKNLFNPSFAGTEITAQTKAESGGIKANSAIQNISLINIQGSGMIGVTGLAARVFKALAENQINVVLITQASSEHSITLAVTPEEGLNASNILKEEFAAEINDNKLDNISLEENMSIIAIIGEKMKDTPGVAGKIFGALGENKINVSAIAQGSSELNISVVVENKDLSKALNILQETFFKK